MKKVLGFSLGIILFYFPLVGAAQSGVAINTDGALADANAMLDIKADNKGVLIPRIDFNNRPSSNIANGMLMYVTANGPQGSNCFYYYNGTKWVKVSTSDEKQTLSLSRDTLRLSDGNYVLLGSIFTEIGYTKCNDIYTQLSSDNNNCGSCGQVCGGANATSQCSGGTCNLTCFTGYGNCDLNSANGCEINLFTSLNNCGACGNICTVGPNMSAATCSGGVCGGICNTGFGNCDATNANGCETNLFTSVNNCGACGNVCTVGSNMSAATCTGGVCGGICNTGFANCDANNANGCETNLFNNVNNCGACGNVCASGPNMTAATCSGGVCGGICNTGFGNCDANNANGCETNLFTSVNNCGACGNVCAAGPNMTAPTCTSGVCGGICNTGFGNCDANNANGCETNLFTSVNNCGACGNVCAAGPNMTAATCTSGVCGGICSTGFGNCDANNANGCETNLFNNINNCGACGNVCAVGANMTAATCTSGVCGGICTTGFANCDANNANGCETNLFTSVNNCGACGNVCAAGKSCVGGVCQ